MAMVRRRNGGTSEFLNVRKWNKHQAKRDAKYRFEKPEDSREYRLYKEERSGRKNGCTQRDLESFGEDV